MNTVTFLFFLGKREINDESDKIFRPSCHKIITVFPYRSFLCFVKKESDDISMMKSD